MEYIVISVARDFSKTPGPRYKEEGEFSGEDFFERILESKFLKAIEENKKLKIDLDGTIGYGTSFLEHVFGGLARKYTPQKVNEIIEIISTEEEYLKKDIQEYINDAQST